MKEMPHSPEYFLLNSVVWFRGLPFDTQHLNKSTSPPAIQNAIEESLERGDSGLEDSDTASDSQHNISEKEVVYNCYIRTLSKTAEDGDGNVGKTIKLITQDKKRTWL